VALFGGKDSHGQLHCDCHILDTEHRTWSVLQTSASSVVPSACYLHSACSYVPEAGASALDRRARLVVYGGLTVVEGDREAASYDTFVLDPHDKRWLKLTHGPSFPKDRCLHSMALLSGFQPSWYDDLNWGFAARYGDNKPTFDRLKPSPNAGGSALSRDPILCIVNGGRSVTSCDCETWLLDLKPFVPQSLRLSTPATSLDQTSSSDAGKAGSEQRIAEVDMARS
jgi:hypothetical protein